jgi:hypothetical protein
MLYVGSVWRKIGRKVNKQLTRVVPGSTPGRCYFCLAFCRSTPNLIAPKMDAMNDTVSYKGALELERQGLLYSGASILAPTLKWVKS